MKTQLVIDGNSIINRAFYGIKALSNKKGIYTNAIFGMTNIILKYIDQLNPEYASVAFDLKSPTFRHKAYKDYKAGRHAMPEELAMQFPYAKKMCAFLGLNVIECEGYEADDILGTLAAMADKDTFTYILTGDRDSLQLINDKVNVILTRNTGDEIIGRNEFHDMYGINPEQFVDMKAIMGDKSDNIPGVAGIGEKGAGTLIAQFGSLDGVYNSIQDSKITEKTRVKLLESKENAYKSLFLAQIVKDAPIVNREYLYNGPDKKKLYDLAIELEFSALISRLSLADENAQAEIEVTEAAIEDIESIRKFSFCFAEDGGEFFDGKKLYYVRGNFSEFKNILFDIRNTVYVYDGKSMLHRLSDCGIERDNNPNWKDILLLAYVANPTDNNYEINKLCQTYLSRVESKHPCYDLYFLFDILYSKLKEESQDSLYEKIEQPLSYLLFDMEKYGFKVDVVGLKKFGEVLEKSCDTIKEEIYRLAGEEFNINSPKQLGVVLFEHMGLPCPKKTKTGYSTSAEVLEKLAPYHEIIDKILKFRQYSKFKSTYADGLVQAADQEGRVHTTFKQTVASTGRLSSTEPNLQNIPVRSELGREFRNYFISKDENYTLIDADYSQIELRLLACIADDKRMIDTFLSGEDIHAMTASQVFGVPLEEVSEELRKRAKAVNFGIVYGIGEFSLAKDIGVNIKSAKKYIENYKSKYPQISEYLNDTIKFGYENGYVSSLFGRRRPIPELSSSNGMMRAFGERVAMNSPIQGSAADLIKIAMVNTDRALKNAGIDAHIILQIHDELIIETNRNCLDKAKEILRNEMENAVSLKVPMLVDISEGENWGNQK